MRILSSALILLAVGCGTSGSLQTSAAQFQLTALPTMVAQKLKLPLYLVAPPGAVPDRLHVEGTTIFIFHVPSVEIAEVRTFVTRDLKQAFESYFSTVQVVDSESKLPATPHVRADIKLASLAYDRRVSAGEHGQHNEMYGALEWGFGLRVSGQPEFIYSFAERTTSGTQMKSFGDTSELEDTFRQALRHLLADFANKDVARKLQDTAVAAPAG